MSSVIEVPDELIALLRENAIAQGKDLNSYAVAALSKVAQQDAMESGSRIVHTAKPITQYIEEQRTKHKLPSDWPHNPQYAMTESDWKTLDNSESKLNDAL